ncbi:MAG: hypothetical protein HYV63_20740 [Candidatus Schekmanbacteria bacterium]|nr:hypothetical protein [Candidatus Schekmanbacteria bacterium]
MKAAGSAAAANVAPLVVVPVTCDAATGRWWRRMHELDGIGGLALELRVEEARDWAVFDATSTFARLAGANLAICGLRLPPAAVDLSAPERCLDVLDKALPAAGVFGLSWVSMKVPHALNLRQRYELAAALGRCAAERLARAKVAVALVHDSGEGIDALDTLGDWCGAVSGARLRVAVDVGRLDATHEALAAQIRVLGEMGLLAGLYLSNRVDGQGGHPALPLKTAAGVYRIGEILDLAAHYREQTFLALDYDPSHAHLMGRHAAALVERLGAVRK